MDYQKYADDIIMCTRGKCENSTKTWFCLLRPNVTPMKLVSVSFQIKNIQNNLKSRRGNRWSQPWKDQMEDHRNPNGQNYTRENQACYSKFLFWVLAAIMISILIGVYLQKDYHET